MPKQDQELTQEAVSRVTRVVRSLADDRVERGVDLTRPMHCDSCGLEKPSAGASQYGSYKLCNDCLLDLTLALASSKVENIADYMTKRTEDPASILTADIVDQRDRGSLNTNIKSLPGRDKLMPSNEPC